MAATWTLGRHAARLQSSTHSVAADCGNDGLAEPAQLCPVSEEVSRVHLCKLLVLHLLDVGTGGKGLVGPGKDDSADRVVGREGAQGRVDLVEEGRVERCAGRAGGAAVSRSLLGRTEEDKWGAPLRAFGLLRVIWLTPGAGVETRMDV